MANRLRYYPDAAASLQRLTADAGLAKQRKAVLKALGLMEKDLRSRSLKTHKVKGVKCPHKSDLFEAYAQNRTSGAWRIFWCHDPADKTILCIVDICPHP